MFSAGAVVARVVPSISPHVIEIRLMMTTFTIVFRVVVTCIGPAPG